MGQTKISEQAQRIIDDHKKYNGELSGSDISEIDKIVQESVEAVYESHPGIQASAQELGIKIRTHKGDDPEKMRGLAKTLEQSEMIADLDPLAKFGCY